MEPQPHEQTPPPGDGSPAPPRRGMWVQRVGHGVRSAGVATGHGVARTVRFGRRAARAHGAGDTGLARLIEVHTFNTAGDAAVAVALAGTLFFVQPGESRQQVLLFLALTMLPFAIVAPLLGPFLDRFSHGRRWAIGATMALRAFLVWVLADAVSSGSLVLFPAALGCLVASKSYGVAKAAAVPRLLPDELTLVKANSRLSLSGVVGAGLSAPLAGLFATAGPQWALRFAFVLFVAATILAILLPGGVDAVAGEKQIALRGRQRLSLPVSVVFALWCNTGLRVLSGFLTMFMAFLLQQQPFPGWEGRTVLLLALVAGAAGLGNTLGVAASAVLKRLDPRIVVVAALVADTVLVILAALGYSLIAVLLLGLTAGVAQSMGKLALDATIQHHVPEVYRTSAFARSETLLQLAWVVGGLLGVLMPMIPRLGFGVLATLLTAWTVLVLLRRPSTLAPA